MIFIIAIYVVAVIGLWKMYVKAGRPGWAAIIPVYNWWVWVEIIGRPRWWFWALLAYILLSWIPIVGFILGIAMFVLFLLGCLDMAKCFGKGTGYGIGLWLLSMVFMPILGFGDAQYVGPVAAGPAPRADTASRMGQPMAPPPAPPAGQQYVPPTPGAAAPPPPLAQPLMPQPLAPPPSQPRCPRRRLRLRLRSVCAALPRPRPHDAGRGRDPRSATGRHGGHHDAAGRAAPRRR